jgi:hypothetical protein
MFERGFNASRGFKPVFVAVENWSAGLISPLESFTEGEKP